MKCDEKNHISGQQKHLKRAKELHPYIHPKAAEDCCNSYLEHRWIRMNWWCTYWCFINLTYIPVTDLTVCVWEYEHTSCCHVLFTLGGVKVPTVHTQTEHAAVACLSIIRCDKGVRGSCLIPARGLHVCHTHDQRVR